MVTYLLENGKIETTVTRAKEVRSAAEKIITTGKENTLHAKRQVYSYVTKEMCIRDRATRARRPAPAAVSAPGLKAARCPCSADCPSAASTTTSPPFTPT